MWLCCYTKIAGAWCSLLNFVTTYVMILYVCRFSEAMYKHNYNIRWKKILISFVEHFVTMVEEFCISAQTMTMLPKCQSGCFFLEQGVLYQEDLFVLIRGLTSVGWSVKIPPTLQATITFRSKVAETGPSLRITTSPVWNRVSSGTNTSPARIERCWRPDSVCRRRRSRLGTRIDG